MTPHSSEKSLTFWTSQVQSNPSWETKLSPRLTSAIPHSPTPKQAAFLILDGMEALYGGAAGGGKSDALLMASLQYIDVPGYAALLLRRRITDSSLPGAILTRSHEWMTESDAKWNGEKRTWTFPSGATLTFGYLDRPQDKFRYQSSEFQFIGFDELTQFEEEEYTYLFSRLRRRAALDVPLRMRGASNPGGVGHDWVRRRFLIEGHAHGRWFIPARVDDNPHLDREEYMRSLASLDHLTRAQLLEGDWNVGDDGLLTFEEITACEADTLWSNEESSDETRCELYVGVDVGRTRDLTVIWTWERIGDVFWCRDLRVMSKASFGEQREVIRSCLNRHVVRCAIDKGGIGYQLAEELEREYPHMVEGVQLTPGVQGRMAQRLAVAFRERRIRIPKNDDLRADLRLVRKLRTISGADRVTTERSHVGHADRFWAAALGFEAAALCEPSNAISDVSLPRSFRPNRHSS